MIRGVVPNYRGNSQGGRKRNRYDNYEDVEETDAPRGSRGRGRGSSERHPPHLRGRAIGMWYASRSNQGNHERGPRKPKPGAHDDVESMLSVTVPDPIIDDVEEMLEFIDEPVDRGFVGWPGCRSKTNDGTGHYVDRYKYLEDSSFKAKFLDNLAQNARAGEEAGKAESSDLDSKKDLELDAKHLLDADKKDRLDDGYLKMLEFRQQLPAFKMKEEILECISNNQVVVLSGETGCGKTTQVPQFILDDYMRRSRGSECRVLCTQPRRISAISVAERVAQERAEKCGDSVGYQIRLQARMPRERGSIVYCTTGILVTKLQSDPLMANYSHVVLDEIHERDVLSDFLLALVKDILPLNPNLKVILMSATLNADLFSNYFGGCPKLDIPGRSFHVEEFYLEDVLSLTNYRVSSSSQNARAPRRGQHLKRRKDRAEAANYRDNVLSLIRENVGYGEYPSHVLSSLETPACEEPDTVQNLALETIRYICEHEGEGAILVFFPGWEDISKLNKALESDRYFQRGFLILPLHSLMPTVNQRQVFDRPPPGIRKIIIATNIAETSITIDDVVFVIDSGKIKMTTFDTQLNVQSLSAEWVSRANASQRKGRAGRVQDGKCYHLFSRARESTFADYPLPEMKRKRLEELCLQIKLLKLGHIEPFLSKVIEPPTPEALALSVKLLRDLNALDDNENLTPLGFHLARLPADPQTGKMLLMAAIFSCLDPITTIAASLGFKDPFVTPLGKEHLVKKSKLAFAEDSFSDHLMLVKAFQEWESVKERGTDWQFCRENFLAGSTLNMLKDMKKQLAGYLHEMDFVASSDPKDDRCNINSTNLALVRAVVCAGLYPNVAFARRRKPSSRAPPIVRTPQDNQKVVFHPKSILCDEREFPSPWLVYKLKQKTLKVSLFDAAVASPCSLLFFGQEVKATPLGSPGKGGHSGRQHILSADEHVKFKSSETVARLIQRLRSSLDDLLDYKITHPGPSNWDDKTKEGALLRAIVELLAAESEVSGLGYADDEEDDDLADDSYEDDVDLAEFGTFMPLSHSHGHGHGRGHSSGHGHRGHSRHGRRW